MNGARPVLACAVVPLVWSLAAHEARAADPPPLPPPARAAPADPWFQAAPGGRAPAATDPWSGAEPPAARKEARDRARAEAEAIRERARREADAIREQARREAEAARERHPRAAPPPAPPHPHLHLHRHGPKRPPGWHPHGRPRVDPHDFHIKRFYGPGTRVIIVPPPPASAPPPDAPESAAPPETDPDGRGARGGISLAAGASRWFGLVPLGDDLMAGARFQAVAGLGTGAGRWLSNAALGVSAGIDVGDRRGVDAQLWHAGAVFALGAPWTRDVVGIGIEGGLIGGRYYDGNPVAYELATQRMSPPPLSASIGPKFYGLGRLTLQVPVKGDVRPYVAGELGVTERNDGRASGIAGLTGGIVWNAW